jgi:hypothetical protein
MKPPHDLAKRLSLALEAVSRAAARAAANPVALIDALSDEFARTVSSEHFTVSSEHFTDQDQGEVNPLPWTVGV